MWFVFTSFEVHVAKCAIDSILQAINVNTKGVGSKSYDSVGRINDNA